MLRMPGCLSVGLPRQETDVMLYAVVRLLLRYNAPASAVDARLRTPLHLASLHGSMETVTVLLVNGASVSAKDAAGQTPLHCASQSGRVAAAALLLRKGASPAEPDAAGRLPIECAAENNHPSVIVLFMDSMPPRFAKPKKERCSAV